MLFKEHMRISFFVLPRMFGNHFLPQRTHVPKDDATANDAAADDAAADDAAAHDATADDAGALA